MVKPMSNEKLVLCNVKLTEDEKKQLRKDAYAHEMNVSDYLRWLIGRERSAFRKENELCTKN